MFELEFDVSVSTGFVSDSSEIGITSSFSAKTNVEENNKVTIRKTKMNFVLHTL